MSDHSSFLTVNQPCGDAVNRVVNRLNRVGLSVTRTFDLQVARQTQNACPCPNHGTRQCDCQMVVLLVYSGRGEPVTLIAHGNDEQTWLSVVDTPQQRADPGVEATIRQVVVSAL